MKIGLVWATNVGKSTLFNQLIGSHRAIVTNVHGTTRDILFEEHSHDSLGACTFLDSPGLDTFDAEIPYLEKVIDQSDVVLFVVDAGVGFWAKEQDVFQLITNAQKRWQTLLIVNKLEKALWRGEWEIALAEYYGLGFSHVVWVSAKAGRGMQSIRKELKSMLTEWGFLDADEEKEDATELDVSHNSEEEEDDYRHLDGRVPLAIVGKPNAGKSTLLNQLLGEDRALVSDVPWTTLDYNVWDFDRGDVSFRLYDTAWIKRKWKMHGLEKIAYEKTKSMLKFIRPMVVFMVDGEVGMTHRDMSLIGEIINYSLPLIICLNKVDVLSSHVKKDRMKQLETFLNFAKYVPLLPISAKHGRWIDEVFDVIDGVWTEYTKRIPTAWLNQMVSRAMIQRPPRFPKNKICKVSYVTQIETKPPTFMVSVNNKKFANFSFVRWLENTIRMSHGFVGVPMRLFLRNKRESWEERWKWKTEDSE